MKIESEFDVSEFPEYQSLLGEENLRALLDALLVEGLMRVIHQDCNDEEILVHQWNLDGMDGEHVFKTRMKLHARDLEVVKRLLVNLHIDSKPVGE